MKTAIGLLLLTMITVTTYGVTFFPRAEKNKEVP